MSLLVVGCTTEDVAKSAAPAKEIAKEAVAVTHDVKCGCSIEDVGRCGNYILIQDKYVPLIHPSLGKMEFCKHKADGAKIETVGAMKEGKFVAESWKLVQ